MKKNIILILALSLFMNGLLPKYSILSTEYDNMLSILENQPLLQCYFSLSSIPINIVTALLSENINLHASASEHSERRKATPAKTSAEFSLLASGQFVGKKLNASPLTNTTLHSNAAVFPGHGYILYVLRTVSGTMLDSPFISLILMLFIMLPRSALSEASIKTLSHRLIKTQFGISQIGFFIVMDKMISGVQVAIFHINQSLRTYVRSMKSDCRLCLSAFGGTRYTPGLTTGELLRFD